jgi:hypothetical protein
LIGFLGHLDAENQMTILDRPGCSAYERVVKVVLLRVLDELLPRLTLERRDPALFDGFGASTKTTEELFDIKLSHGNLLVNRSSG